MNQVKEFQYRVNNLSIQKKETSFVCFKVKQKNMCGLALIDTGNVVHTAIVSGDFWESIGTRLAVQWTIEWGLWMVKVRVYKFCE